MRSESNFDGKQLENLYWKGGLSIEKIAIRFGCSPTKAHYWLVKYGVKRRKEYKKGLKLDKELLEDLYIKKKMSLNGIADRFNCNGANILYWLKKYDIKRRPAYRKKVHIPKATLERLYWKENLTTSEIAKMFGIRHGRTILKKIAKYNIKSKTLSQALTKKKKFPFSGDLNEKAYLLGLRTGDFHVKQQRKSIRVQTTTTHLAQIKLLERSFNAYGEHRVYYSKSKSREDEWFIYTDLHPSFEFLLEKPREIPEWVLENNECFFNFLSAYMDCEGTFCIIKSHEKFVRFIFRIKTGDMRILEQVREKLISYGFNALLYPGYKKGKLGTYGISRVDMYDLIVYRKKEVLSLIEILLPLSKHSEKIRKMELILKNKHKKWDGIIKDWNELRVSIKLELLKNQALKN